MLRRIRVLAVSLIAAVIASGASLPVRGIHMSAPKPDDLPLLLRFIREGAPKEGVNTLVLEINYRYQYTKHPEVIDADALTKDDLKSIAAACRQANVKFIPMINLLGHQSWAKNTFGLLRAHPEFDETPGKYPDNEGIYCRSYCPLNPAVHEVLFDLIDELMDVSEADTFHGGMDEVFLLGEDDCPRCRGRLKAGLFADEVRRIRDHLAQSNRKLWIWGDRLLDGAGTGVGKWEGSFNQTHPAIDQVPKDVVICDWHYDKAGPTAALFALHGFNVISAPWRKPAVALGQLDLIRSIRANAGEAVASRMMGILQTTWGTPANFIKAYFGETPADQRSGEVVDCFRRLFAELRASQ
jgi:hypothetical protein